MKQKNQGNETTEKMKQKPRELNNGENYQGEICNNISVKD